MDLIEYCRRGAADFIGLPEGSDLGGYFLLDFQGARVGKRKIVQLREQLRNVLALPKHRAPRYFGWMSSKDGYHSDTTQRRHHSFEVNACLAGSQERAFDRSRLRRNIRRQLHRPAPAFPVVGLRQIRQLEIHGERFGEFGRVHHVHCPEYAGLRLKRSLAAAGGNAQFPQALDHLEQLLALLFSDDVPEQPSQRAHIATQGTFFVVLGRPEQLVQSLDLIRCPPQRFVIKHRTPR